jgi:putative transposase
MKTLFLLIIHFVVLIFKLLKPGGLKTVAAENLAIRQQLIVATKERHRAPPLTPLERILFGLWAMLISKHRIEKIFIIVKPDTILRFHQALVNRKNKQLFSRKTKGKPGPKGPSQEMINAIVEMKNRNPRMGCPKIALQINHAFGTDIDKDIVRRILEKHYKPNPNGGNGPSWLTFIGHMKDSLWSFDLFRCESVTLKSHWVMVIIDQYTRRIIGFAVKSGSVDGVTLCCLFNQIISGQSLPKHLSTDNDPLFLFHRWQANLRILDIDEIKSVPNIPVSHPFVERLIGTTKREILSQIIFWNERDLQNKLDEFQQYYNTSRTHYSLDGQTPEEKAGISSAEIIPLDDYRSQNHCRGLFQTPLAA